MLIQDILIQYMAISLHTLTISILVFLVGCNTNNHYLQNTSLFLWFYKSLLHLSIQKKKKNILRIREYGKLNEIDFQIYNLSILS